MPRFVIITPAHNEEAFIEKTIQSIVTQTVLPLRWVVVNDGSTDSTGEIVERYRATHRFIDLINLHRSGGRHFGNKVKAFNLGLAQVHPLGYEYIGNLDADISLEQDYFKKIFCEFDKDPKLGIAGGSVFSKIGDRFVRQGVAPNSVAGSVQLFRRVCFEQIGGYLVLPLGGIDAAAEITARMRGWKVRTIPGIKALEHRRTGWAAGQPLAARVKEGERFYSLGYTFLFFFLRCLYRSMGQPWIVGGAAALFGYLRCLIRRDPFVLPPEIVQYLKTEQRKRILQLLKRVNLKDLRDSH